MKSCNTCGKQIDNDSAFCPGCGCSTVGTSATSQTKFCGTCGMEIQSSAVVCTGCGCPTSSNGGVVVQSTEDAPNVLLTFLGVCFPSIGFWICLILFIVWRKEKPLAAKSAGLGALIGGILTAIGIIIYVIFIIFALSSGEFDFDTYPY